MTPEKSEMVEDNLLNFEDPDFYRKVTLDDRGRLNLGKEFANEEVRVLVERVNKRSVKDGR